MQQSVKQIDEPQLIATMTAHDLWMAFIEDTGGNRLALMSEVRED